MQAYHNDESLKATELERLKKDGNQFELIVHYEKSLYHSTKSLNKIYSDQNLFESTFAIPKILLYLRNRILALLPIWPLDHSITDSWTYNFMSAIEVGADLSNIWAKFVIYMLTDEEVGMTVLEDDLKIKAAILNVANLHSESCVRQTDTTEWHTARINCRGNVSTIVPAWLSIVDISAIAVEGALNAIIEKKVMTKEEYATLLANKLLELLQNA